ncbi:hypothetical protein FRC11_005432, partial [Ceratobasidium sp. 423]
MGSNTSSGGNNGAYAGSSGGYSPHSGNCPVRTGPNSARPSRSGATVGRSLSIGSRPVHRPSQSGQYLAPPGPRPKRHRPDEVEEESEGDGGVPQNAPGNGKQRGQTKRL